ARRRTKRNGTVFLLAGLLGMVDYGMKDKRMPPAATPVVGATGPVRVGARNEMEPFSCWQGCLVTVDYGMKDKRMPPAATPVVGATGPVRVGARNETEPFSCWQGCLEWLITE
ncbi:MAG: hypothetical protein PHS57_05190, partial [Alphaproteobacteria bacterium]|nr:hypothetical protein [Alphaproteobacteria bacterium]